MNAATAVRRGFTPIGFARELDREGCDYKVVNGLGEFYLNIRVDPTASVIDMFAGPTKHEMQCSQRASSPSATVKPHTRSRMFHSPGTPDELFESQHQSLQREFGNIEQALSC